MLIGTIQAHLIVNKISTNNGYIEINCGKVEIVKNFDIIIHNINVDEIKTIVDQVEINIDALKLDIDKTTILKSEITKLKSKLHTLVPHRHKRGLVNFIGKAHKWLYGTMDSEDREDIEKHLSVIDTNNHNIIQNLNQQVKINNNFNESFGRLKDILEKDRTKILDTYNQINSQYKNLASQTLYIDYVLKIKILQDNLEHIQDNIESSRSGILHSGILTPQEIKEYDIDINKLKNIKVGSLFSESNHLIFIIMVPREILKLDRMIIFPITNDNYEELLFESEQLIRYNNKTYEFIRDRELPKLRYSNNCVIKNNCMKIRNNVSEIIEIETGIVLVKNVKNLSLSNNCNQKHVILNGNYLIKFRNCTIDLDNHILYNNQKEFKQAFVLPLLEKGLEGLNKKLTFDEIVLQQVQNNKEIIELKYQKDTNLVINGVIAAIGIIIFIFIIISAKRKVFKVKLNFKRESLSSRERGVMSKVSDTTRPPMDLHVPKVTLV